MVHPKNNFSRFVLWLTIFVFACTDFTNGRSAAKTGIVVSRKNGFSKSIVAVSRSVLVVESLRDRRTRLNCFQYLRVELSYFNIDVR